MTSESAADSGADIRRYEALLELADLMVHHRGLPELFQHLAERLRRVIEFDFANFALYDSATHHMRLNTWVGAESVSVPTELELEETASGWVWQNQECLYIPDLRTEKRFPLVAQPLRQRGLRSCFLAPLTTAEKRLGAIGLASSKEDAYGDADIRLLRRMA